MNEPDELTLSYHATMQFFVSLRAEGVPIPLEDCFVAAPSLRSGLWLTPAMTEGKRF